MTRSQHHVLVFGASGAIGSTICRMAVSKGWRVAGVARSPVTIDGVRPIVADPLADRFDPTVLDGGAPYCAVCWAQGMNTTDSVYDVDYRKNLELYGVNCLYILVTLKALLTAGYLQGGSRLCVISSIWQEFARQDKLSYCMTKAALEGLVLSASADLAADGHLINAVLPGAIDTPMTRNSLTRDQIERITAGTRFHRLTSLDDVASAVCYLCSPDNTGITGQFIATDLGWSRVRIV